MKFIVDDLTGPEIAQLLTEHLREMHRVSPHESVHALDIEKLQAPEITFWTVWKSGNENDELVGCGALREIDATHGEIKSMRVPEQHRGRGVAKKIVEHLLTEAKNRNYGRISLETGSMDFFEPARSLYKSFGFEICGPFAEYRLDPNSVFMTKTI